MSGVDGIAAGRALLARGTCSPGLCLYYVWLAYKQYGATSDRTFPTALSAWEGSPGKHYDRNPPAGVPVYFGAKPGSNAGDVVISLGGGLVAATDWPVYGAIGQTTITQRMAQINRPYLGWTDNILGFPISQAAPAGDGEPYTPQKPAPKPEEEEDDMDMRPITILRVDASGNFVEGCRLHPEIGTELKQFVFDDDFMDEGYSRQSGFVRTFRGGMVSDNWDVVVGWRRTDIKGDDIGSTAEWISAQKEWSRFVVEISGEIPKDQSDKPPVVVPPVVTPPVVVPPKADPPVVYATPVEPAGGWPTNGRNATSRPTVDIQKKLIELEFLPVTDPTQADGNYGRMTSKGDAKFQASRWLEADGVHGATTDGMMFPPAGSIHGVDYSFARPDPKLLKARGVKFVVRYLFQEKYADGRTSKGLSRAEYDELRAAGLDVVFLYEYDTTDLVSRAEGTQRVNEALVHLRRIGLQPDDVKKGQPIIVNADRDVPVSDYPKVFAALRGVADVVGLKRTWLYGKYDLVRAAFDAGVISGAMQAYAWSYGKWEPRAQLQQWSNGQWGGAVDFTRAMQADFGQKPVT